MERGARVAAFTSSACLGTLFAAVLLCLLAGPAPAATFKYNGQTYTDGDAALAAAKRDMAARAQKITPSANPIKGQALIVVPDNARVLPWVRGNLRTTFDEGSLSFVARYQQLLLRNIADEIVRARIFEQATVDERNDTIQPSLDRYDYLVWFQIKSVGADFSGPWIGHWFVQKRGTAALPVTADPGAPKERGDMPILEALQQQVTRLDVAARTGVAPAAGPLPGGAGNAARRSSSGSGGVIDTGGTVLTNAHVVQGCVQTRVIANGESINATVLAQDTQNDLAVLRADRHFAAAVRLREGAGIQQGDEVLALGYPLTDVLSSDVIATTGTVSALAGLRNDTRQLQISAPVQPGNSGGPLLDLGGNLVGVVQAVLASTTQMGMSVAPQNVNFAIKTSTVREFLDANHVHYMTAITAHAGTAAAVVQQGKKYTVRVECWR
ncbi:MAG TPA: serine protease [Stellaceae bacterium]|nr:serine protease [Stellaceae bacterium]